jgi:hypothetical protein
MPDPPPANGQSDRLFDANVFGDYLGFTVRAVQRNLAAAGVSFAVVFGAIWIAALLWPKTYQADGRLLVQRNEVMSSLVNPGRTIPREAEIPTRAADEIVRGRDILLTIIKETNLLEEWDRTRAPLLRLKDGVMRLFQRAPTKEERIDAMVGLLEDRLQVGTTDQGAVSFILRWPDPQMASRIVDKAMQGFLDYRRVSEASAIADSIAILDRSVEALEAQVNATLAELPRAGGRAVRSAPLRRTFSGDFVAGPSPGTSVRLARLRSALESREQDIARLEGLRSQQLADAQTRLAAAQAIYTEGHPTVLALRQTVSQLSSESPELAAARRDARNLAAEYDSLSTKANVETANAERATQMRVVVPVLPGSTSVDGTDPVEPVGLRLKVELAELGAVRERANAARAELSSSQAGFKYQYTVLRPPQVPRFPLSPNVPAILAAGAIASLLLALAVAVGIDLAGGLVLQAWQVKRQIGVPVTVQIPKL